MRILVVEDEEKLANVVARSLKEEGFAVDIAADGAHGLELATSYAYEAIILDIMLPELGGAIVLDGIRQKNRNVPIIMLTAKDAVGDKVTYLDAGADDYLTKPFSFEELLVRIRALLRRAPSQREDVIRIADLEIDRLAHQVKRAGKRIELSAKEYALLEYLSLNAGRVLSRTMIIERVWDESFEALTNIVDVYIRQLRGKIDEGHENKLIKTVRGVGYVLNHEEAA
ncbi:MAG: response regulator transcription factor [Pseudomonadota bacterium]|nr:response regulator transcription factor [Pseudomonadota bacterium]MDE3037851.1 response regulator transcription factor [Pseudomonadota bacterium]